MSLVSIIVSTTIIMMSFFFQNFIPGNLNAIIQFGAGPAAYLATEYVQKIYKYYKYNKVAQSIYFEYSNKIDESIKEDIIDLESQKDIEKFLDYQFIYSQTNYYLNNNQQKKFVNESMIDVVYSGIKNSLKISKVAGLVIGDVGVGKTTLINELLKLPDDQKGKTETQTGESVTQGDPIKYNNDKYLSWLILFDSQGFDKVTYFEDSIENMKQYIEDKFKIDGNEFVNFIIYCIKGERFTKTEKDNLIKLHNLYPSNKLPTIVLNTRGLEANADSLMKKIKKDFEDNYNIKDLIYLTVSAIQSSHGKKEIGNYQEFGTLNMDKLVQLIKNISCASLNSTLYKLFFEKIKEVYKQNIESIINNIDLKNISNFDENYELIMEKCLRIKIDKSTLNTLKTHYFKILEKETITKTVNQKCNNLRVEYEKKTNELANEEIVEQYKKIYIARVSEHAKNGTIILMKKLLMEDLFFKDILENIINSHKIEVYVEKLIREFKKLNKL